MLLCCAVLQLIDFLSVQVRGALETLLGALTPIDHARAQKAEVHAAPMNSDLLSREAENITLLLSLLVRVYSIFLGKQIYSGFVLFYACIIWFVFLGVWQEEEDFYVRYYTLQILTALLMNSQNRYIFWKYYLYIIFQSICYIDFS